MNVHISYKAAKTPDVEQEIQQQLKKLGRRLQVFQPDLVHLHGSLERRSPREGVIAALNLRLPSGQMAARESAPKPVTAVKSAFEELLRQLKKHKELLRNQHARLRKYGKQPRTTPFEETLAAVHPARASNGDVSAYLDANLERLKLFAQRELRYREATGRLPRDLVTAEEVVDEAVVAALADDETKPELLTLERWLYRLAIRAIADVAQRNAGEAGIAIPLELSARKPNVTGSDESLLQYHQPDEALQMGDIVADARASTPEEIAANDEFITQVEAALFDAPKHDREAFVLYALEGFTLREISQVTDRPLEQVRASILAAREHLRKKLPLPTEWKDKLLQHSQIA